MALSELATSSLELTIIALCFSCLWWYAAVCQPDSTTTAKCFTGGKSSTISFSYLSRGMSSIRDSEHGQGFLGGAKSLSLGSSLVAGDMVATSLGLVGLDDNAVFLGLLEEAVLPARGLVTAGGDGNFVCFLFGLLSHSIFGVFCVRLE